MEKVSMNEFVAGDATAAAALLDEETKLAELARTPEPEMVELMDHVASLGIAAMRINLDVHCGICGAVWLWNALDIADAEFQAVCPSCNASLPEPGARDLVEGAREALAVAEAEYSRFRTRIYLKLPRDEDPRHNGVVVEFPGSGALLELPLDAFLAGGEMRTLEGERLDAATRQKLAAAVERLAKAQEHLEPFFTVQIAIRTFDPPAT